MEKKQLDLDAPLISVRRFSSTLASSNKPIKKKAEKPLLPQRQHSLPLPKSDWDSAQVTKPAAVPFLWEQIPGRRKAEREAENSLREVVDVPRQLLDDLFHDQTRIESNNGGDWNSERGDDEYSDALEALSASETLSMNCSTSGLSQGCGGGVLDSKRPGTFSTDVQTRDFMMKRFLPAAKAMVLETPQYVAKKQPTTPEHPPRPVRKVVSGEIKPPLEPQTLAIVPHHRQNMEDAVSDDEDEDKHSNSGKKLVKFRGLFSRFCLRNSLCLLNPVPGMKTRSQVPVSPSKDVRRMARTAYSGPLTQTTDKNSWNTSNKQKTAPKARSQELHKIKNKPTPEPKRLSCSGELRMVRTSSPFRSLSRPVSPYRNEPPPSHDSHKVKNKPASESNGLDYSGDLRMMRNLSPYRSFTRGSVSPYQSEAPKPLDLQELKNKLTGDCNLSYSGDLTRKGAISPYRNPSVSPFREGVGFLGVNNDVEKVKDVPCPRRYKMVPGIKTPPAVEKTVYVDSVNTVKLPLSESISSGAEKVTSSPSACASGMRSQVEKIKEPRFNQAQGQELGSNGLKVNTKVNLGGPNGDSKADDSTVSPRPPPLPKSPSESWLWRTLPSIALPKKQNTKASNMGTKWETIVKTSNVHHDHVRYSEELVARVSQRSKT